MGVTNSKLVQVQPPISNGNGHMIGLSGETNTHTGVQTRVLPEFKQNETLQKIHNKERHQQNRENGLPVSASTQRNIRGNMDPIFEISNQRARVRRDLIGANREINKSNTDASENVQADAESPANNNENDTDIVTDSGVETEDAEADAFVLSKALYDGQLNVHLTGDNTRCDITGCSVFGDDKIAIADNWNSSVKIFGSNDRTFLSGINLDIKPWDISDMNTGQLVATCNNTLSILNVTDGAESMVTLDRVIQVQGRSRGIAFYDNVFIVTFIYPESSVKLIQQDGNVVKVIHSDSTGLPLFKRPEYVAFNTRNHLIYVTDFQKNSLTCLTFEGEVDSVHTGDEFRKPTGVVIDDRGHVLVAGWGSENIHKFTKNFKEIQTVLHSRDIITYPQALTFYRGLLFMSHYHFTSINNYLSVYRLDELTLMNDDIVQQLE